MQEHTVSSELGKGRQDVVYKEVVRFGDHTFKVAIRSDSYSFQSWAKVSRWDGSQWQIVHSIHYSSMTTQHGGSKSLTKASFRKDRTELVRVAREVCGI
jgi:hypothetical protein